MGLHPSLRQLLRFQTTARIQRWWDRLRQPRRLALTLAAAALACLWLGQAILGILFRGPADPVRLQQWMVLGFMAYAGWHVLKSVIRTPIEPFEWTATEQEILGAAPVHRAALVRYRLAGILPSAIMKSACFALVMLPDLRVFWAGWLGMFLALVYLDLIRMLAEIVTFGVPRRTFIWLRVVTLCMIGGLAVQAIVPVVLSPTMLARPDAWTLLSGLVSELTSMTGGTVGQVVGSPFHALTGIILAPAAGPGLISTSVVAIIGVGLVMACLVRVDEWLRSQRVARERRDYAKLMRREVGAASQPRSHSASPWRQPPRMLGVAPFAWRQWWGARKYKVAIIVSLIVPGVLSLLPMFAATTSEEAAVQMTGSLVFYSLVLLPAAFKFDFRRDLDRLVVLKALPISPWAIATGQLLVPVALCSAFQGGIMLVGMMIRPYSLSLFAVGLSVMFLANTLIFALENLIFLMYPYRLNQEGIDIFFRSIIVLTAKTLLFGVGLALTLGWALFGARWAASLGLHARYLFFLGFSATILVVITTVLLALVKTYQKFDPSQDVPALS